MSYAKIIEHLKSSRFTKMVKALHLYFASIWSGGAASIFAIHCLFIPLSGAELYARNMTLIYIDDYVIMPAATGCFITGLIASYITGWGYIKFYWIVVKWVSFVILTISGWFWFIPWMTKMADATSAIRNMLIVDPGDMAAMDIHMIMAFSQSVLILFLVVISVYKPWGKFWIKR